MKNRWIALVPVLCVPIWMNSNCYLALPGARVDLIGHILPKENSSLPNGGPGEWRNRANELSRLSAFPRQAIHEREGRGRFQYFSICPIFRCIGPMLTPYSFLA